MPGAIIKKILNEMLIKIYFRPIYVGCSYESTVISCYFHYEFEIKTVV